MIKLSYFQQDLLFIIMAIMFCVMVATIATKVYDMVMCSYCKRLDKVLSSIGYHVITSYDNRLCIRNIDTNEVIHLCSVIPYLSQPYIIDKVIDKFTIH